MKFRLNESTNKKYLREERVRVTTEEEYNQHPVVQTANEMCRSHGYELSDIYWKSRANLPVVHVVAPYRSNLPEVRLSVDWDHSSAPKFVIQTTSVGSLTIPEYKKFLQDMEEGLALAEELTTLLPTLEELGPEIN